jgi:hypothetical protein
MKPATLLIVVMAMFFFLIVLGGGGGYFLTRKKDDDDDEEGEECEGPDKNAEYEINEDGYCVFSKCKTGYTKQSGYCVKQRDYTGDFEDGLIPKDCKITKYIPGACVNEYGVQLDGTPGLCGKGKKTFRADTENGFELANSLGECNNLTYTQECTVECKVPKCSATKENYTKTDDICYSSGGVALTGNKCGSGFKTYEVNPATAGTFDSENSRNEWVKANWGDCTPIRKICTVPCETGMDRIECPELSEDIETSYVLDANGEKACFPKNIAVALLKGETRYDNVNMPMPKLTRANAERQGITEMKDLPSGYSIKFKSGAADFNEYKVLGCDIAQLEPCKQPTEPDDCKKDDINIGSCYNVRCGLPKKKTVEKIITKDAWGSGGCNKSDLGQRTVECSEDITPECCDVNNITHWTNPVSYTCSINGTYNLVNTSACSNYGQTPPVKIADCCYVDDWVDAGCNNDGDTGKGKRKYTRNLPKPNACTDTDLGGRAGDVYYEVDPTCSRDCTIGSITFSNTDDRGNQLTYESQNGKWNVMRIKSYSGSKRGAGFGQDWCKDWESSVCQNPECTSTGSIYTGLYNNSLALFPPSMINTPYVNDVPHMLRINPRQENYFSCGSNRINGTTVGMNCGKIGNRTPSWTRPT